MPVAVLNDMVRDLDAPSVERGSALITDAEQQPSVGESTCTSSQDEAHADRQAQTNNGESIDQRQSSSESLEAFVAEAEHKYNLMAQDVLAGQEGDGEGGVAASFDNSLSPDHDDGDASSLCSLRAELAQATPEKAGIVFIEEDGGESDGADADDNSSISGGGSMTFGDGGSSADAVATPKAGHNNIEDEDDNDSERSTDGRDQTPPGRRRSMGSASGKRASWLRLPGLSKNNVSTRTAAGAASTTAAPVDTTAGPPPLAQPLTPLDHVLLEDMSKDDIGVVHDSFRSKADPAGPLEDMSVQSRALAAGAEAGAAAAVRDDSSIGATTFMTASSQFFHPLHSQKDEEEDTTSNKKAASVKWSMSTRRLSEENAQRRNSFGSRQPSRRMSDGTGSAAKPPGMLVLGDLATSIRSLSTLGGGDDNISLSPSVSTMASSIHSGAVIAKQRSRFSLLNDKLDSKLKLKMSRRRLLYEDEYYHDEDDIDFQLEEEIFAEEDAINSIVLQEAHELMAQVNKSVSSMGVDPPFQPTGDILPSLKHLHESLKYHFVQSKAAGIVEGSKFPRDDRKNSSGIANEGNNESKKATPTAGASQQDALPALDDREAIVQFFMQRMKEASLEDANLKPRSDRGALDYQQFTAFIPNFLWYQPISEDASSVIRPTSLCSGTGIGSGLKYIDPEMMAIFALFGSYFAGALSEEEKAAASPKEKGENFCPRRSARWLNTIDEGDDSESDAESKGASDDADAGADAKNEKTGKMAFSEEQMTVIQNAIEELLAKQMGATIRTSKADTNVSTAAKNRERTDASPKNISGNAGSSEFHSDDEDSESGKDEEADGFLVGFPQSA